MFGADQTKAVQMSRRSGNMISVHVSPNLLMTNPVPNKENKNDMLFVVYNK